MKADPIGGKKVTVYSERERKEEEIGFVRSKAGMMRCDAVW